MAASHYYQSRHSLRVPLDPKSLMQSQFPDSNKPQFMQLLTTDSYIMERGPRYKEYSDLRDNRLKNKITADHPTPGKELYLKLQIRSFLTPPTKQAKKFNPNFTTPPRRPRAFSTVNQSTPDFASSLRKENRKPLAAERWITPPAGPSKSGKMVGGSRSANSVEKRGGGVMARRSSAGVEELKGMGGGAGNAIGSRGILKTVLGYRQF